MRKIIILLTLLIINDSLAHVPLNERIINNPLKSWVIYDQVQGEANTYEFNLSAGERLRIQLLTPEPTINLTMSLNNEEIIINQSSQKTYEPFTPSSYYYLASINQVINETKEFELIINGKGKYGLAIGYIESFSIIEWLRIPIDTFNIHVWEGQNPLLIMTPLILIILIGAIYEYLHGFSNQWLLLISALSFAGSSSVNLTQMIISLINAEINASIMITIILNLIPIIISWRLITLTHKKIKTRSDWLRVIIYGVSGLIAWAGYIIGPVIIITNGLWHYFKKN